jgi:hypothetical protein
MGLFLAFTTERLGVYLLGFEVDFNFSCLSVNFVKCVNKGRRSFYWYSFAHKLNPRRPIK